MTAGNGKVVLQIYPASFNHLRKVLSEQHEDLWAKVGYNMAFNQLQFITDMNAELGVFTIPEMTIQECCEKYLAALKNRVGKPARKSFELIAAERQGRVIGGTDIIFGGADADAEREDRHKFAAKKGIILP